jgi:hypothetical protein
MKNTDPVMQEVWRAKEANAKTHLTLTAYMAYLRKQSKKKHAGGRVVGSSENQPVRRQIAA